MRVSLLYATCLLAVSVQASWFGSDPEYSKWSQPQLKAWLDLHGIQTPKSYSQKELHDLVASNWAHYSDQGKQYADASRDWTYDQYTKAQHSFNDLRDSSFDTWDESTLRQWLLEHGVVAPSGPREELVLLAKQRYRSYTDAASYYSSLAGASAGSAYSEATGAVYGASKSASSFAAQATNDAAQALDDTKDYVYSTWDDNKLRDYLEKKGVVEAKDTSTHSDLLRLMRDQYNKASDPVWESWSDSYMREWLIAHNLLEPSDTSSRSTLVGEMKKYYYGAPDYVWTSWDDSKLKAWLVDHGIIKSNAQKKRDELLKLLEENYTSSPETIWSAWSDSDIRKWLVQNNIVDEKTAAGKKRDQLIKLIQPKYHGVAASTTQYLAWPDARLRAYLRERGISEDALPTSRPGLLQETRIRWVQTQSRAETMYEKIAELVNSGVEATEEKIARIYELLTGTATEGAEYAEKKRDDAYGWGSEKKGQAEGYAKEKKGQAEGYTKEKKGKVEGYGKSKKGEAEGYAKSVKGEAKETGKKAGEKIKQTADEL
ncbi:hypothetical protein CONPUDRAFT_110475 [Coniophora puteana RWD-64-598 SS2]|uniref:Uncharacterized protein n=1 Tax=Coniophora puteana (strain RWD-64-598) TaxID=741705 RepID=A0A5M3MCA9_CONPW|nr:uncharacterized protein CONPUDRAFT_110475 [Coniophora puteana RWD-64-598 SS2]EIW76838.1 hypothetical protein CONPUDRAFT_110475 [Coniophora puteana RWD-64-598 SS2]